MQLELRQKKVVENIRKDAVEIFIEFQKYSNIFSRVIRLENKKLNKFKMGFFENNFQLTFSKPISSQKIEFKINCFKFV